MKILFSSITYCFIAIVVSGCALFNDSRAKQDQFIIAWNKKMINYKIIQIKSVMDDSIYSDFELQTKISKLLNELPEDYCKSQDANLAAVTKKLSDIKLRRANNFRKLSQSVGGLKPVHSISKAGASEALENARQLLTQLNSFQDFKEYPALSAKLDTYLLSLFLAQPELTISADKAFRSFPSETNKMVLSAVFSSKAEDRNSKLKKVYSMVWKNFESILKTDKRFAAFLKSPDEIHWEAFKSQVARIGYPENELVHRRYNEYIRNVDHCRRIFFTLKYWELADSGFINRKKGDIGIRIWSWQQRTFFRQIAVENAERNWHSDPSFSSKGDQKKISHPLIAKIDNDFIRMVCIHFQNSSGRTIESQVFKYSIYQLAALTYKTGTCELKLEGSPVNHAPGPRKGLIVMTIKEMPKLETYSD